MRLKPFFIFLSLLPLLSIGCSSPNYNKIEGFTQGTTYNILFENRENREMGPIIDSIFREVDLSVSIYNSESLLSKINRGESDQVDSIIATLFRASLDLYYKSDGLFDISASPLFELWGFGATERGEVTEQLIEETKKRSGMDKVRLEGSTLIKEEGVTLSFNAIAKGYTCDLVAAQFDQLGIENYLIEIGGEIFCRGVNSKGKSWSIGVDKPKEGNIVQGLEIEDILLYSNGGLATSGNYRKFYREGDEIFAHTIDPITGYPAKNNLLSATVLAKDAMSADGYATWFMVAGVERAIELLEENSDIEGYLIYAQEGEYKIYISEGVQIAKLK